MRRIIEVVPLLLLVSACDLPAGWKCTSGTCSDGEVCRSIDGNFPECHKVCSASLDCEAGKACIDDVCQPYSQSCSAHSDCRSEYFCAQPGGECLKYPHGVSTCTDGITGQGETDRDCGGNCPPCMNGEACLRADDCSSHACVNSVCTTVLTARGGLLDSRPQATPTYLLEGSLNPWGQQLQTAAYTLQPVP